MKVIVTARHCEVPDEVRDRDSQLIEKVAKKANRPHRAEIVFDDDHNQKIVELQLSLARGQLKVCRAEADDFRTALDRALDKLGNQLDKVSPRPSRRAAG